MGRTRRSIEGRLNTWAFVVLVAVSGIGLAVWRLPNMNFVSVHTSVDTFLHYGDAVMTRPTGLAQLHTGDLVSYYDPLQPGNMRTSRVQAVHAAGGSFVPAGAEISQHPADVSASLLIGKVHYRLSYAGYLLDFVRSRLGLVLGVYLPALIILNHEILLLAATYRRQHYRLPVAAND
ncbi:MAG TPA: hypothetical protein VFH39_00270 [Candidatus Saccharimonadales bacterium]|nr:hypothetical protein [Candidatus Saccharimonadales bacterium]